MEDKEKKTILVIDDDDDVLFLIGYALKHLGIETECTTTGTEGLERYRQKIEERRPFAAVIADLSLPGNLGARELIVPLLSLNPSAKVFVTSGYSDDPALTNFKALGFTGALPKPITVEMLREMVLPLLEDPAGLP
uniref:Response regulator transcription factor n=1 Tax=Geobacter metallireducens TaxID=28232 RepID=A0A831U0W5_GEOME